MVAAARRACRSLAALRFPGPPRAAERRPFRGGWHAAPGGRRRFGESTLAPLPGDTVQDLVEKVAADHAQTALALQEELRKAAVERADLRSQLRLQVEQSRRRTELLTESLQKADEDRAALREQVEQLSRDFHMMTHNLLSEQVGMRERVQRKGVKGRGGQSRMSHRPSIEYAMRQPTHVCEMGHQSLAELALQNNHSAHRERVLREIMCVDNVSWGEAHKVLTEMDMANERYYWAESLPYRIGIASAFAGAVGATLLVFNKPIAVWYAENVAGEELPEGVEDIAELTTNQVGTWTWSWMEPMIGTASFVLLCCQFSRAQMSKMNMKTYGERVLQWRADRLARKFPEYDRSMVRAWAKRMPRVALNFFPIYDRDAGMKGPTSGL